MLQCSGSLMGVVHMRAALRCTTQGAGEQYAVIPLGTKRALWSAGCLDTSKCQ